MNNMKGFNGTGNSQSSLFFGGQVGDVYYQMQDQTLMGYDVVRKAALVHAAAWKRAGGKHTEAPEPGLFKGIPSSS